MGSIIVSVISCMVGDLGLMLGFLDVETVIERPLRVDLAQLPNQARELMLDKPWDKWLNNATNYFCGLSVLWCNAGN